MNNNIKQLIRLLWLLFIPSVVYTDVLIDVTATFVAPACDIRSENNTSPLKINFDTVNIEELGKSKATKDFSLYLSKCDFSKSLAVVLNPKGNSALRYQGRMVLGTSIKGLGIDFNEITGGITRSLDVNKHLNIYPKYINATQYQIDLQAILVSSIPIKQLEPGAFTSTMTVLVIYN